MSFFFGRFVGYVIFFCNFVKSILLNRIVNHVKSNINFSKPL